MTQNQEKKILTKTKNFIYRKSCHKKKIFFKEMKTIVLALKVL